ncbi:MAG: hypothetical protein HY046_08335 [Acidobacteria bacterium]|nr:hypothetical protein [Acidobacteriota bacterium]
MSFLFSSINSIFDLFFLPFRGMPPIAGLTAISIVTAVLMLLTFRFASNQAAIRRAKDQLQAHLLAVQLFPENLRVVFSAYGQLIVGNLKYLQQTLKPLAVMLLPIIIIMVQIDLRMGAAPIEPGRAFLLKATVSSADLLEQVTLRLPDGIEQTAPPVRIPSEKEIDWRLQARTQGSYDLTLKATSEELTKRVEVQGRMPIVNSARVRGNVWEQLLNMGESPVPNSSKFERIEINYEAQETSVAGFRMHWMIPFFVISMVAGLALKRVVGAEF